MNKKNLTPQQLKFCENYARGLSAIESYKSAYSSKGVNLKSLSYNANKLLNDDLIIKEIEKRKEKNLSFLNYSVEKSFNKIKEIQEKALEKNDLTNALKAEEMIAKLTGINQEKAGNGGEILNGFKEFYAAICLKKDYGSRENEKSLSKTEVLPKLTEEKTIELKQ